MQMQMHKHKKPEKLRQHDSYKSQKSTQKKPEWILREYK
jgi:hypothetical protein